MFNTDQKEKEKLSPRLTWPSPNASIKISRPCGMGVLSSRFIMQISQLKTHANAIDGTFPRLIGWRLEIRNVMSSWNAKLKVFGCVNVWTAREIPSTRNGIELFLTSSFAVTEVEMLRNTLTWARETSEQRSLRETQQPIEPITSRVLLKSWEFHDFKIIYYQFSVYPCSDLHLPIN